MNMSVYQCSLCRRTVFSGRRKHVYEKGHQKRLADVLKEFGSKVDAARKMIKAASVVKFNPQEHEKKFWCHCCGKEVGKHTSDGNVTVLYGSFLEHFQSSEHAKAVNKFWWIHQAEAKLKLRFILTSEDYERFKSSVVKALENYEETEDTLIKEVATKIRETEQRRLEMLQSVLEPVIHPTEEKEMVTRRSSEQVLSREMVDLDSEEPGPSGVHLTSPEIVQPHVTFIGQQVMSLEGNIHTGAIPPWMLPDEKEQEEIGPSHAGFLKHKEIMKLKKLPPNRVGANFDHNAQTNEAWLPSFGRVWNNGRRWQSRHQYRKEEENTGPKRRKYEEI
ncbi:centrosomal AT-AC splicing factor [Spea bombifrons]|uniref:centrosomal AT-AC splicing factor n=1 Tax=Spea bombifrons TaxID=233779 RepID=UPI0023492E7E|nr:centrosomal AT-AC splicing factor [Spea bombifrons]